MQWAGNMWNVSRRLWSLSFRIQYTYWDWNTNPNQHTNADSNKFSNRYWDWNTVQHWYTNTDQYTNPDSNKFSNVYSNRD